MSVAPAFGSISSTSYGAAANSLTVTAPSGIADGDVLIASIKQFSGSSPITPDTVPSGWTQVGTDLTTNAGGLYIRQTIWIKVASSESGNYTWGWSTPINNAQGVIARYTGCSGVVNTSLGTVGATGTTNRILTGLTTTVPGCMIVSMDWDWGDNTTNETPPEGFTERLDMVLASHFDMLLTTGASSTGTVTNFCNSTASNPRGGFLIALEPTNAPLITRVANVSDTTTNGTTSMTVTIPTVTADDLLMLWGINRDSATVLTVSDDDSGGNTWTRETTESNRVNVWWKRATSGTSAKTITLSGATGSISAGLSVYRGAITSGSPFGTYVREANASADESQAGITPTEDDCMIVFGVGNRSDDNIITAMTAATSGAFVPAIQSRSTGGSDCSIYTGDQYQGTAAATGSITWAQVDGGTDSIVFFIKPQTSSGQTLLPSLFTNTNDFFAPTITTGQVELLPSLFTNTNTFYGPTVTQGGSTQDLFPALFTNSNSFFGPTILVGSVTLAPSLFTNTNSFFSPTVSQGVITLEPSLFTNSNSFFAPTVTPGTITLTPALFTNTNSFFSPTVSSGGSVLTPALFTNTNSFFAPTVTRGQVELSPSLFTNTQTFFSPTVTTGTVTLSPSLFVNQQSFFAALVYDTANPPVGNDKPWNRKLEAVPFVIKSWKIW